MTEDAANLQRESPQGPDAPPEITYRRKPRFTTLRGVRREFGALYLDLLNGRVQQKTAGTAGSLLNGIVKALEVELLERRLVALEERAGIVPPRKTNFRIHMRPAGHA